MGFFLQTCKYVKSLSDANENAASKRGLLVMKVVMVTKMKIKRKDKIC